MADLKLLDGTVISDRGHPSDCDVYFRPGHCSCSVAKLARAMAALEDMRRQLATANEENAYLRSVLGL